MGDLVWKAFKRVKRGRTWSLAPHFKGPYEIVEVLLEVNYRIRLVGKVKTLVEHFDHLTPFYNDEGFSSDRGQKSIRNERDTDETDDAQEWMNPESAVM